MSRIPFFIPTVARPDHVEMDTDSFAEGLELEKSVTARVQSEDERKRRRRILDDVQQRFKVDGARCDALGTCSRFIYFLKTELEEKEGREKAMEYAVPREYLLSLTPSAANAELRCVAMMESTAKSELMWTLKFFVFELESNRNFEHWQSMMSLFLRIHSDLMIHYAASLGAVIGKLAPLLEEKWNAMNGLFQSNLCLVQFYSRLQQ